MALLQNKNSVIMGVANNRSIATAIAVEAANQGANLGFSFLKDDTGKMESRVRKAVDSLNPAFISPCNVNNDADVKEFFSVAGQKMGKLDHLVHSIAFAPLEDIRCATVDASRQGFLTALESSCFSLIATVKEAVSYMEPGSSIITLSYLGGERVIPGYNLMGVAKAALENAIKYLAHDLGPKGIRINGISAGPIKTLASSAVGDFGKVLRINERMAPLGRNVTTEEVAKTATFLMSDMSSGITGELIHVDAGYHVMGHPGYSLENLDS